MEIYSVIYDSALINTTFEHIKMKVKDVFPKYSSIPLYTKNLLMR